MLLIECARLVCLSGEMSNTTDAYDQRQTTP